MKKMYSIGLMLALILFALPSLSAQNEESVIRMTTAKEVGEKIELSFGAGTNMKEITIEGAVESEPSIYTLTSQDVVIKGKVTYLSSYEDLITKLDISGNPYLRVLKCNSSLLEELDLSKNKELTYVSCNNNNISKLIVGELPKLEELHLEDNNVSNLELSNCFRLKRLELGTKIKFLKLSHCNALKKFLYSSAKEISISNCNSLEELYVSYCDKVKVFACEKLKKLSILGSPNINIEELGSKYLEELRISSSNLKEIPLSNYKYLKTLDISYNRNLNGLDVSQNKYLKSLRCDMNNFNYEAMEKLINSLPNRTNSPILIPVSSLSNQKYKGDNTCTTEQVERIKAKGWLVQDSNGQDFLGQALPEVKLTTSIEGKGTISFPSVKDLNSVPNNTEITIEAQAEDGYELQSLMVYGKDITEAKKFTIRADTEVKAVFAKKTFAISKEIEGVGFIEFVGADNLNAVPYGTELFVKVTNETGYRLKALEVDGLSIVDSHRFLVKANSKVKAVFEKQNFALRSVIEGEGELTFPNISDLKTIPYDTEVEVKAIAEDGYTLKSLTANGKDILAGQRFHITEDTKVEAVFVKATAIEGIQHNEKIVCYPNPTTDFVILEGLKANSPVKVYSMAGLCLFEAKANEQGILHLKLGHLASGYYLIKTKGKSIKIKVLK